MIIQAFGRMLKKPWYPDVWFTLWSAPSCPWSRNSINMEFLRSLSLTALPLKRASFSETQLINLDPNEAARNQSEEGLDAMSSEVAWNRRRPTLWQYLTEWWMPRLPSSDCSNCKLTRRWMLWIVKSSVIFFSGFTFAL
jgi:hypothetical protein